jgi:hypothetical protein
MAGMNTAKKLNKIIFFISSPPGMNFPHKYYFPLKKSTGFFNILRKQIQKILRKSAAIPPPNSIQ